jgi:mannose/fructose/N-acetylgalactosamine-specific phosphotransferase system component IIB
MTIQDEQLAQKVVEIFKKNISEDARAHISETEFQTLAKIVREALSLEITEVAEMVDKLEKQLREKAVHLDLDL